MNRFDGKVIVITGAAGGLGKALALLIAREGGMLLLSDRSEDSLKEIEVEISKFALSPHLFVANACDEDFGKALTEVALKKFGRIDGFVPCAGMIRFSALSEITPAQWDDTMNLNLRSTFFSLQCVSQVMIAEGKGGSIVTISSTSGNGPRPNNADYGVSKAGINHLTRTFALELASHGIRVNAVSPGVIETAMWRQVDRERGTLLGLPAGQLSQKMAKEIPLGRIGRPEEVADLIAFLLSDQATYITGQIITIDGGFELNHA
ncbi:MAG: SDR family NAD(P)-dependent oxidoreductase [Chthoniobacterales bacterium]